MDFDPIGGCGTLNRAYETIDSELPGEISESEKAHLAVEVYKAWLLAEGQTRIANAINGLTMSVENLRDQINGQT